MERKVSFLVLIAFTLSVGALVASAIPAPAASINKALKGK